MKRILFVDDEPRVLEGMENMFFDGPEDWEVLTAPSGKAALEVLDAEAVDVLVTDMRMPGMDGAQLLEEVRTLHPGVLRFVLTGHAETGPLLQALAASHQVLSKPCSSEFLVNAIERALELDRLLSDERLRSLVGRLSSLPGRPKFYTEVCRLLARETTSLPEVSAMVESDVAISARLLKTANTAFFSRGERCETIPEALARLGLGTLKGLLLEMEVNKAFASVPEAFLDRLNERSRRVAMLARQIGIDYECANEAFMSGILVDIGKLLFTAIAPREYPEFLEQHRAASDEQTLVRHEEETYGASHAALGAYLLGLWGLPYPIIEAVANHHRLGELDSLAFGPLEAVQVACRLADRESGARPADEPLITESERACLAKFGADQRLSAWTERLESLEEAA